MVARNAEDLMASIAQSFKKAASLLELLGLRPLGEVAADHDKIGPELIDLSLDRLNETIIVSTKMQVRKMNQASHENMNASGEARFSRGKLRTS